MQFSALHSISIEELGNYPKMLNANKQSIKLLCPLSNKAPCLGSAASWHLILIPSTMDTASSIPACVYT